MKTKQKIILGVGAAFLFLLVAALAPKGEKQMQSSEAGMRSLASEPAADTRDFRADTNETVTFRRVELQIPAAWSAETAGDTLYLSPTGTLAEDAITVRPVPLEVPEGRLADSGLQNAAAEMFFSAYRTDYVDFTVVQEEYAAAGNGCPELFLCAFEGVRDDVKASWSAGFFVVDDELYVMEVPCGENSGYNCTGDAYRVLCSVTAAPEPALEPAPEPTPEPPPELTPEPTPTPEEPTAEPEEPPEAVPEPAQESVGADYVLNTNTKKFHIPSCSSVKKMKESNKQFFTGTRDEVIARGYSPCGNCHP